MKTGVKVSDAMTKRPVVISPDESVITCAKLMVKKRVGGVIVKENGSIKGIVTEKDLVDRVLAKKRDQKKVKVKDVMSSRIIGIDPNKDIHEAIVMMGEENIRRLPVVFEERIVGMLTAKDILKIEPHLIDYVVEKFRVREEDDKSIFFKSG